MEKITRNYPSSEEWKNFKKLYASLEKERADYKYKLNEVCEKYNELVCENTKIKELLKECREKQTDNYEGFIDYIVDGETANLIKRIDKVLGNE